MQSATLRHARASKKCIQDIHDIPFAKLRQDFKGGVAQPPIGTSLLDQYAANEDSGALNDFSINDIYGATGAIFIAGGSTTWSTIILCILNLLLNPAVCSQAQTDIDRVVGGNRLPTFEDRAGFRYIDFIVQEVYRWALLSPVGIPHRSLKADVYRGMFLPAESLVYANACAMGYDEETYAEPSKFDPDRFIPKDEVGAGEPFAQGSFGFGRRYAV